MAEINIRKINAVVLTAIIILIAVATFSAIYFGAASFAFSSAAVAVCALAFFFFAYEKGKGGLFTPVITAVMTAIAVSGRLIFSPLQAFKPVAAVVIVTGIYLGGESGFICGAFSALISNIFFGQGPWTPFQMLCWGLAGFIAGVLSDKLRKNRILLCVYGAVCGILYSLFMDLWSTIWEGGSFSIERFSVKFIPSLPFMIVYAISNIIFLFLLSKPFEKLFKRIETKFGF